MRESVVNIRGITVLAWVFFSAGGISTYAQTLRILPLGNSITQSDKDNYSYRYKLWEKLTAANGSFDFVGTQTLHNGESTSGPAPSFPDPSFDRHHEGRWGWFADEILNGRPSPSTNKLQTWLQSYEPDVVLMHVGSNDAFNSHTTASTINELEQIIDVLRADNPNVIVLLALLIPTTDAGRNSRINALNTAIPGIVVSKSTAASPIILVDQNTGFNPVIGVDTWDGVHPNASGEEKMAQKWYEAILPFLPIPTPVRLLSFVAKVHDEKVVLRWSTASEVNNKLFSVEHSLDGSVFTEISTVEGAGNSSVKIDYTVTHHEAHRGNNYYRLKQIDFDGTFEYSKVVAANITGTTSPSIYPNPATEEFVVDFSKVSDGSEISIWLLDSRAAIVREYHMQHEPIIRIPCADLPAGIYTLKISTRERATWTKRLVVN
jgi:hypothetical protein